MWNVHLLDKKPVVGTYVSWVVMLDAVGNWVCEFVQAIEGSMFLARPWGEIKWDFSKEVKAASRSSEANNKTSSGRVKGVHWSIQKEIDRELMKCSKEGRDPPPMSELEHI